MLFAGPGDQALTERLMRLSKDLGIANDVVWTGPLYKEAKWDAMRAADAYVLPSHQENFGISVVESLACGTPVLISQRVNIWREVHASGAGFVQPDSVEGTTNLLNLWSRTSPSTRESMSAGAAKCFSSHFNIKKTGLHVYGLIKQKLTQREDESIPLRHGTAKPRFQNE